MTELATSVYGCRVYS